MHSSPTRNKGKIIFSLSSALVLLVAVYFFDNVQFSFGGLPTVSTMMENHRLKELEKHPEKLEVDTNRVFINSAYDQEFVSDYYGKVSITDRAMLLRFLRDLEKYDNYREVFIDIRFEKGLETEHDSALVEQLVNMRNVFVAKHWDYEAKADYPVIDDRISEHSAYADYGSTLFNNSFTKYQFLQPGGPSAALKIYEDLDGRGIKRFGHNFFSIYWDRGLCFNSQFIRIAEDYSYGDEFRLNGDDKFHNLGNGIYGYMAEYPEVFDRFFKDLENKIVIVGDFVFDTHDTYYKKQPGPYLNYLAYTSLHEGSHIVNPWISIVVYLLYVLILLIIVEYVWPANIFTDSIRKMNIWISERSDRIYRWRLFRWMRGLRQLIHFTLSFLGYAFLFSLLCFLLSLVTGFYISVFIPSVFFSLVEFGYKYKSHEN